MTPKIIDLPRIEDRRGNLTFLESNRQAPFEIRRVYYLYDVPGGCERGAHGHKELEQVMIAVSGSFDVALFDGREKYTFTLNRAYAGLYVPRGYWRQLVNFSSNAVCLVLASLPYDEADYIRDYDEFCRYALARDSR